MMNIKSGYYTTDGSDLYLHISVKYQNDEYVKGKVKLFYKKGDYKDYMLEEKNYKMLKKNIGHWKPYSEA